MKNSKGNTPRPSDWNRTVFRIILHTVLLCKLLFLKLCRIPRPFEEVLSSNIGAQSQLVDPFGCAQDHIKHSLFLKFLTWIAEEFFAVSFQDPMWWSKSHQSEVFPLNLQTACIVQDHSITSLKSKNLVIENLQDFWQIYFNTCLREF